MTVETIDVFFAVLLLVPTLLAWTFVARPFMLSTRPALYRVTALVISVFLTAHLARHIHLVLTDFGSPYTHKWRTGPWPVPYPNYDWSSAHEGWFNNSQLVDGTKADRLQKSDLVLTSSASSWGHGIINLALFHPGIAVTSSGHMYKLKDNDFKGLVDLGTKGMDVGPGRHYNTLPEVSDATDSYLRLFQQGSESTEFGVYVFQRSNAGKDHERVPAVLMELFGLMQETRFEQACAREKRNECVLGWLKDMGDIAHGL